MTKNIILGLAITAVFSTAASAGTLDDVKKAGVLKCGVTTGLAGFSSPDKDGKWTGIDVDTCRA
ncbi:MAG: amino acid ABC transporter substrate-binding protein, partial [Cocleimonas sp.]|nr:amino acid ABC transporter substrate-binding protein [Cocleimonas sp.]